MNLFIVKPYKGMKSHFVTHLTHVLTENEAGIVSKNLGPLVILGSLQQSCGGRSESTIFSLSQEHPINVVQTSVHLNGI